VNGEILGESTVEKETNSYIAINMYGDLAKIFEK
jgi:hypothetical protein